MLGRAAKQTEIANEYTAAWKSIWYTLLNVVRHFG